MPPAAVTWLWRRQCLDQPVISVPVYNGSLVSCCGGLPSSAASLSTLQSTSFPALPWTQRVLDTQSSFSAEQDDAFLPRKSMQVKPTDGTRESLQELCCTGTAFWYFYPYNTRSMFMFTMFPLKDNNMNDTSSELRRTKKISVTFRNNKPILKCKMLIISIKACIHCFYQYWSGNFSIFYMVFS